MLGLFAEFKELQRMAFPELKNSTLSLPT